MNNFEVLVLIRTSNALEDGERLERNLRKNSDGSGYGFGERDLSWYFPTKKKAENFKEKVLNTLPKFIKNKRNYSVKLTSIED